MDGEAKSKGECGILQVSCTASSSDSKLSNDKYLAAVVVTEALSVWFEIKNTKKSQP